MNPFTFSLLLFTIPLLGNGYGTYPLVRYVLDSNSYVVSQDPFGNIFSGGDYGLKILKEGEWEDYGPWTQKISHIETAQNGELWVGNQQFFGKVKNDSLISFGESFYSELDFAQLHQLIVVNSGSYVHLDGRILRVGKDVVDFNYDDVIFAGKLNRDLIVQRQNSGLYLFAGNNFRKINNSDDYAKDQILSIVEMENGRFLLIFQDNVVIYDGDNFFPWSREGVDWIRKLDVSHVVANAQGIFVTSGSDLYQLDANGSLIRAMNMGQDIDHLFGDQEGNLWITSGKSIASLRTSSPVKLINALNEQGTAILKFENEVFIGTERGAYRSDETSFLNGGLPLKINDDFTYSFYLDGGQCLISDKNGLDLYNGRINEINTNGTSYAVLILDDGATMIEASSTGLNLYEKQYGRWNFLNHLYGIEEEVNQIIKDERDRIWVHSQVQGIFLLNYDPTLMAISPTIFPINNLSPEDINGIFLINGKPIITSNQGIFEFNEKIGRFEASATYNSAFGDLNDIAYLYQDEYENIWYVSEVESGVLKVIDKGVEKVTQKQALPYLQRHLNLNQPFVQSLDDDKMIFAGDRGFVFLNQGQLKGKIKFQVHLYGLENYNGQDELIDRKILTSSNASELFIFPKKSEKITFKFSTNYSDVDNIVMYSYNINETGWSEKTSSSQLTIGLPGGKNTVKVRAHYGFNELSNTLVVPVLIEQDWFMKEMNQYIVLGVLLLIAVILFFIMWSIMKSRKKKNKRLAFLMDMQKKEIEELRDKNEILSAQLISAMNENDISKQLEKLHEENEDAEVRKAIRKLIKKLKSKNSRVSENVHPDPEFIARLKMKYPSLTRKDIKLCSLLKMDLTTKDIAPILDITVRGVEISRYRLRKKLELDNDVVLSEFLKNI